MKEGVAIGGLALALVLATAGCGGDDAPSRAEFVEDANAICVKQRDELDAKRKEDLASRPGPLSKAEAVKNAREETLPSYQQRVDELRKLRPPRATRPSSTLSRRASTSRKPT